ncbi:MAG TPA: hypothetical protein VKR55_10275 [Bradyrhizobium sp.]|nr:hypothetical protein [Bradyrhizobium sp.]HLZ02520.1 hypothetical protein [Bradyrhizobium sp.]
MADDGRISFAIFARHRLMRSRKALKIRRAKTAVFASVFNLIWPVQP